MFLNDIKKRLLRKIEFLTYLKSIANHKMYVFRELIDILLHVSKNIGKTGFW